MVRIDPATGAEVTELSFPTFLERAWGMEVGYTIAAYNDIAFVPEPRGGEVALIGLMAFITIQLGSSGRPSPGNSGALVQSSILDKRFG